MDRWGSYRRQVGTQPNPIVGNVLSRYKVAREKALDLGAGNLRDSKFLKSVGFKHVVAVDLSPESPTFLTEGIELETCSIEAYRPEANTFDFVISCNTMFFLTSENAEVVFRNIFEGLRSGGIFVCNVLGPEDDWIREGRPMCSFTKESLTTICGGFRILGMNETKDYANTVTPAGLSTKFWHQWSVALQKP